MRLTNYEYKNVSMASCYTQVETNEKAMNELGAKGWKLVARTADEATFMREYETEYDANGKPVPGCERIWM